MKKKIPALENLVHYLCGMLQNIQKKMASMTLNIFSSLAHTDIKPQKSVFGAFILWGKQNTTQNLLFIKVKIAKYFSIANILQLLSRL